MEALTARLLRISGRVQGVGYRDAMRKEATRLQLDGWVRNRADGSVEALVHGQQESVELLIAWARQGPRFAKVEEVDISLAEAPAETGFAIRFD
jgi:acylphosphatase